METLGNNIGAKKGTKGQNIYHCEKCDYTCCKKYSWERHIGTSKHNQEISEIKGKKGQDYLCENCDKCFHTNAGLWKHNKNCKNKICKNNIETPVEDICENKKLDEPTDKELMMMVVKQNAVLIKENCDLKNMMMEVIKNGTHNTIHTNSHNKTFNLQLFLNETCKDAMNMSDFINSLKLQLSDLESVGKLGFVDGISNIIIKNLEALDVEKRPVHCCDSKRETMYIKDQDKWEKEDNDLKRMKELVRYVRDKNISMVNVWRDLYPECVKSDSKKTTQFNEIYMESFGGEKGTKKEKEEKIISRIAKSVVIDKTE